ncbi:MAG: hypothetical protein WCH46_06500 [bacterium]
MKVYGKWMVQLFVIGMIAGFTTNVSAQNFREESDLWKTETLRATNTDTIKLERHSFFALPKLNDTTSIVYHEPMPDSIMPKSAIEIGEVTVQGATAEDVIAMLEKQARKEGADWIVSFNEPRLKFNARHEGYYKSQAVLYKVINADLVPEANIAEVNCTESHILTCDAAREYVQSLVAHGGE